MSDETERGDNARPTATRGPAPTARRIRAGALLLTGGAKDTGDALRKAGYATSTARAPRMNGLAPEVLMREAMALRTDDGKRLGSLRPLATRRLRRILEDPDESAGIVGQVALAVHKVANELGENDSQEGDGGLAFEGWRRRCQLRAGRVALHLAEKYGLARARELVAQAGEYVEQRYPLPAPSVRDTGFLPGALRGRKDGRGEDDL